MEQNNISPDDPRLTAYALNEMEPAERAEFEQSLAQDAAARQAVAEISATASLVTQALEQEPMEPAARIEAGGGPFAKIVRFPYWTISSLAAACFAVFFIYWQRNEVLPEQKHYIQLPVAANAAKAANLPSEPALTMAEPPSRDEMQANEADGGAKKKMEAETEDRVIGPKSEALAKESVAAVPVPATPQAQGAAAAPAAASSLDYFGSNTLAGTRLRSELKDSGSAVRAVNGPVMADRESNTEAYSFRKDNDYLRATDNPLSTFSVDVDTASYANVRRFLTEGQRPPADAVRIEELVNYFPYNYAAPHLPESRGDVTGPVFAAHLEVAAAPWAPAHRLVRIGLAGRELSEAARPASNLVFLLDVSGSMAEPNKLPLVKQSLRLLVQKLRPDDHVAIAVYAGSSGLALPSTSVAHKAEILDAIDRLEAEGSTNGAMGIQLAYDVAKANFIPGGVNRVILATDGDFNVGVTSEGELVRLVSEKAKSGVALTVLGFGMGNLKDGTLEQLADKGNGNYAYIDTLAEAKKALVEQAGGTLVTIAKDVKIQVEFNPAVVQAYRLIGYENRLLAKEDFNNDQVDAGEVGAGHTVTALYEVVPVGAEMPVVGAVDALKYSRPGQPAGRDLSGPAARQTELLTVKIRYKEPEGDVSSKLEFPLYDTGAAFAKASQDFKFAAAVAAFGMVLRDSPYKGTSSLSDVLAWARDGLGNDAGGYRSEFIGLVVKAQQVMP